MEKPLEIVVSFSRTLNHSLYGGAPYENTSHFASAKITLDSEANPDEAYAELDAQVKKAVGVSVDGIIVGFQGGLPYEEFQKFIYDYAANRLKDVEYFDATRAKMSKSQRDVVESMRKGRAIAKSDVKKTIAQKTLTKGSGTINTDDLIVIPE